jgi:hypothetical protein
MDMYSNQIVVTPRMAEAIDFAITKHAGQLDKAGKPYFGHVLRVALAVLDFGEDYFISAILHDIVEDCDVELSYIEQRWGIEVAEAVESVTRRLLPFKETYMNLIERASRNVIGREIKWEDLKDNSKPDRIAALPIESRDIVKRYDRAKKFLLNAKANEMAVLAEKRHQQMLIDGGGA